MNGGLLLRQFTHHDGVDSQCKGGGQCGDGRPVEFYWPQDDDDAAKSAEDGKDAQRGQLFPEQHDGQHHDQDGGCVEHGVGGGQREIAEGDDHAQDASQVYVGPHGVDLDTGKQVFPVELAGQGQ